MIEIVELPIFQMVIFHINHNFPMVFPWFSHGFPMVFPWFPIKNGDLYGWSHEIFLRSWHRRAVHPGTTRSHLDPPGERRMWVLLVLVSSPWFFSRSSDWWLKNHLEKYESQWEGLSHTLWKIKAMFETTNQSSNMNHHMTRWNLGRFCI